jgi:hypothetical protein
MLPLKSPFTGKETMAFDHDELIPYKGNMIAKGVIWHKVKSLGWTAALFGQLNDTEIVTVLNEKKTPTQMNKSVSFDPKKAINLDSEEGSVPEIMGAGGAVPRPHEENGPIPLGSPISESGVTVAAVAPSTLAAGKHLRPVDPTRPATSAPAVAPGAPAPTIAAPQRPVNITVKPPRTDHKKLQSMLEAAYALAQNEATYSTAKTLIQANGLERPFQQLHTELSSKLFGRLDTTPDSKCRGGVVLDIEVEADSGYVHIVTTSGTITITGQQLAHKGADS